MRRPLRSLAAFAVLTALAACAAPLTSLDTSCSSTSAQPRCEPSLAEVLLPRKQADDTAYNDRFLSFLAQDRLARLDRANGTGPFGRSFRTVANREFQAQYRALQHAASVPAADSPQAGPEGVFEAAWRASRQTLYIDSDAAPARREFRFSGLQARSVEITVQQVGAKEAAVTGSCDGAVRLRSDANGPLAAGQTFRFGLGGAGRGGSTVSIFPGDDVQACRLAVHAGPRDWTLELRREETADPKLAAFDGLYQRCSSPDPAGLDALQRAFYSATWLSKTCAFPLGDPELLPNARDGFNAKVEALTGSKLADGFFEAGDPEAPIDFSRAPDLSVIYFSYLEFKADFSGRVMERLIRFHAARGATIRIMVTRILERELDRAMLERLAADFPNVQLQQFTWEAPFGAPVGEQLSALHKTHHVKMLATVARDPRQSRVVTGGRNIHDGFLFHRPLDLSRYPNLQQYGKTSGFSLNYYSNWNDFELAISDPDAVRVLTAHLATLWHRDADTNLSRPFSIPGTQAAPARGANARHFMSVPYTDDRALEDYYVALFDAAAEKIEMVNPYLNLPPRLAAAMERALDRGIAITIIGRIDMKGDIGGKLLTALNELFVEKYADRVVIREYKSPDVVLHSKILMIDGRYVSVSSVNLNNRSFFHDSENGIAVLDPAFYLRMKKVFDSYMARSRHVGSDVHVPLAYRLLFSDQQIREVF